MQKIRISNAKLEDMDFFLTLAKNEGWNPGLDDAIPFYATDPKGFFIGERAGEKIGCISAVAYDDHFGFMGFYIVIPQQRGKGFGLQLWKRGLHYLGERIIGLDGVPAQQESYKKFHFQFYYRNIRFEGTASGKPSDSLIDLRDIPFEKVLEYDKPIFGLERKTFLENWMRMPNAYGLGKIHNNQLLGYGVIRRCVKGYKIGPLFCDDLAIANELYEELCSKVKGPVFLDVPELNENALRLAASKKLVKVFETARMYNKPPPQQMLHKVFGVTSFELG